MTKLNAGEYKQEEMTLELALKYLDEFSEKNNLKDDTSILIVESVKYVKEELKKCNYWDTIKDKLSAKQLLTVIENK